MKNSSNEAQTSRASLEGLGKTANLPVTQRVIFRKMQSLWNAVCERERAEMAALFPETSGHPQYVHNWIICGKDEAKSARAEAIRDIYRERWVRIRARYERESARREHVKHVIEKRSGYYLWCNACVAVAA